MSKTAFIFPGQGSQYIGMGKDLCQNFAAAREVFEEGSDTIGLDLKKISFEGPQDLLNLTANTQPAILTASIAVLKVLKAETGFEAVCLAGHSLGEYTALFHSGVFTFSDAVKIVRKRGELMQEAVPAGTGAMAAILGMEKDDVEQICNEASALDMVSPANFNSPGQIVVAGSKKGVEAAVELAKEKGAKRAIQLPVSVPSHCSLMEGAGEELRQYLEGFSLGDLDIPVVSNVEAEPYPGKQEIVNILVKQLSSPVRWDDSVRYLKAMAVESVVEVGPGKVLSGLVKRIDRTIGIVNVEDSVSLKKMQ
ncbi:MAG: ACP S-malonyltransferase [Deltaproteobacteria bacterium]|nr:ACP S-malonyltransferase [Deltaproteobacteria bacterium]